MAAAYVAACPSNAHTAMQTLTTQQPVMSPTALTAYYTAVSPVAQQGLPVPMTSMKSQPSQPGPATLLEARNSSADSELESETESGSSDDENELPRKRMRATGVLRYTTRQARCALIFGVFAAAAQGALVPFMSMLTSESVTVLTNTTRASVVDAMCPVLTRIGLLAVAQFVFTTCWQTALAWAAARWGPDIHLQVMRSLLKSDIEWFDKNDIAGLPGRMEQDVLKVDSFMSAGLGYIFSGLAQFFAGMALALYNGWQLTLVVGAVLPTMCCVAAAFGKQIESSYSLQDQLFARASSVAEETLMAIRTVVAFGAETREQQRFEKELTAAKQGGVRAGIQIGFTFGLINSLFSVIYALTFWYSGHYLIAGDSHVHSGHVMSVLLALIMGISGLGTFSGFAPTMGQAVVGAKDLLELIENTGHEIEPQEEEYDDESDGRSKGLPSPASVIQHIEFRQVGFRYPTKPDVWALRSMSFQVRKGQKVAFVGESGSGKSTSIQLLERYYDPCNGEILVNGLPLHTLPVRAWRRQIGYVGQEPVLFATSVMENLKAGDATISDQAALEAAHGAQILPFITSLPKGPNTVVGAAQMSGGQKQRLAIARAMARQPQLLLLDEATASLDNRSERMVQETIDRLQDESRQSFTIISVAHRLSTIQNSDVIFVLSQGNCCEFGSHYELMQRRGEYFKLAISQSMPAEEEEDEVEHTEEASPDLDIARSEKSTSDMIRGTFAGSQLTGTFLDVAKNHSRIMLDVEETGNSPIPRLCAMARRHCCVLPMGFLVVLLSAMLVPVQAIYFNRAISSLYEKTESAMLHDVDEASFMLILISIAGLLCMVAQYGLFSYVQESLTVRLRTMAFGGILRREIGFFDSQENQTSSLLTTLGSYISRVSMMLGQQMANSATAVLTAISSIAFSFTGSWQLASGLLALIIISAFLAVVSAVWANKPSPEADAARASLGKSTAEAITKVRTVRALGYEKCAIENTSESLSIFTGHHRAMALKRGLSLGLNTSLVEVVLLVGFWLSSKLMESGTVESAKLLLTIFCIVFGLMSATTIAAYLPDAASGRIAAAEVFRLIDHPSEIDAVDPDSKHQDLGDGSINLRDIVFSYPHRPGNKVLKRIRFTVQRGQAVALVGFSGSGKSTIMQLLQRFYDPTAGEITIGGVPLTMLDVAWWRRQLGVVEQEPVLFDASLEDNVKYGRPEATRAEVEGAARIANMDYVLNGTKAWEDRVGLGGATLSGGQKQRCAIARAVLRQPQILLLDEATSALDSTSEALVQDALQKARLGKTMITIAHRLSTIQGSDQIFVLAGGQLVEAGTYRELVAQGGVFANLARRSV
eukprot:TRINITY_DN57216_c0_g1_i1.p1 TRINITY_DN57216_c0_g1~~TRINITY_DN57216_c0_g1_i1.p1  ORF type:complete len:1354 (+),score=213.13 TRINITY_DN57216_c0_g1_i1:66-4064(+)